MKHSTPELAKFKKLQRRLGLPRYQVIGILESLWICCQKNAPRGDIGKLDNEEIAIEIDWQGDPSELVAALVQTGWLDPCEKCRLVVHHWPDHAPRYVHGIAAKFGGFVVATSPTTVPDYSPALQSPTIVTLCTNQQPNLTKPNLTKEEKLKQKENPTVQDCRSGKRFIKPTPLQVEEYGKEIGFTISGEEFCDAYEAKGWVVGKAPMKDWKAAVRTWKNSRKPKEPVQTRPRLATPEEEAAWRP